MTDPKEDEVFYAALQLPDAGTRAAFLTDACEGDDHLRARLEARIQERLAAGGGVDALVTEMAIAGMPTPASSGAIRYNPGTKPRPTEKPGDVLGRYKLLEQVGEGGFGLVYVAEQLEPVKRRVALKVIKLGMDTKEVIARFEAERQALALMDHPNIAKVFDAGATETGRPYFVMELVRGIPITKYCDENSLPIPQRLELFSLVCDAIQHAHQKGIIHRDIKPSNILVTVNNGVPVPKVIDFGIAKATQGVLTDKTIYTQFQQFIGTPAYASPEQADMTSLDIDTRSDIYSLGVLLYELLSGKVPFDPETLMKAGLDEMRRIIREQEPPRPSTRLTTLTDKDQTTVAQRRQSSPLKLTNLLRGDLDWIVMKALEKDRTRRYESASMFAQDIQRHLKNEAVLACPPSTAYVFQKLVRRHKLMFAAAGAVTASLIIGLSVATWMYFGQKAARAKADKETEKASRAAKSEQAEKEKAKAQVREASRSDTATAQQRLAEGKWQEGVAYLGRALRYNPENTNAQQALWLALRHGERDAGRLPVFSIKPENGVGHASFSPDGNRVIISSADSTTRVWDMTTGQPVGAPLKHGDVANASFSLDGTRVVTASRDRTARVWDATTGQPISPPLKHDGEVTSASFSPSGTRVVTASLDLTARVWDATTGQPVGPSLKHDNVVASASFSPDGTRVVTASKDGTVRVWDTTTGQPISSPLKHDGSISIAGFSPDGSRVITAGDNTARVWDATTGQPIGAPLKHENAVQSASFSPDGTRIATASGDTTARVWDATTGQPVGPPLKHDDAVWSASFSPDGTRVVTRCSDNTARVWDATTGQPVGPPLKHDEAVWSASFSSDGTRVVTATRDYTARVWEVTTSQPISAPLNHQSSVSSASFSPDGTRVLTVSSDNTARVWDATTGQPVGPSLKHDHVQSASFSPDGTRVITAGEDTTAHVWDATSGQPVGPALKHDNWILSASFSPDGTRIVTASLDKTARVWDATTGQPISAPLKHEGRVWSASFSPDGTRVVTASEDKTARVWDVATSQPVGAPLNHQFFVRSASFSPDGTRIVTASLDLTARVWDATTGQPLGPSLKHNNDVVSASFSPDGTRVITASEDTARVWDATTRQPVGPPLKHKDTVLSASFSPDGTRVVTASRDNTARVWEVATRQPIGADIAENLTTFIAGARLDPYLGSQQPVSVEGRLALWQKLKPMLAALPDWRFTAEQAFHRDPQTALVSPRMTMTRRQAATTLIGTMQPATIRQAAAIDPAHPLLPFVFARIESEKTDTQPANPIRAAWLVDYGMKRLPTDTSAADLRLAARLVAYVAKTVPRQKATARALLDRAAKITPETDETRKLRLELEK